MLPKHEVNALLAGRTVALFPPVTTFVVYSAVRLCSQVTYIVNNMEPIQTVQEQSDQVS